MEFLVRHNFFLVETLLRCFKGFFTLFQLLIPMLFQVKINNQIVSLFAINCAISSTKIHSEVLIN